MSRHTQLHGEACPFGLVFGCHSVSLFEENKVSLNRHHKELYSDHRSLFSVDLDLDLDVDLDLDADFRADLDLVFDLGLD